MRKKGILVVLITVSIGALGYYFFNSKIRHQTDLPSEDTEFVEAEAEMNPLPATVPGNWKIKKIWDIHRVRPDKTEKDLEFVIHNKEKISQWFEVEFENQGQKYLLFVTKVQSLSENGEIQDSHGQSVLAGAGLYRKKGSDLELVLVNEKLGEYGAEGDVAEIKNPLILQVGAQRKAIVIEGSFCNQGECSSMGSIVEISSDRLEEIGSVNIGGDNSGQCDDESDLKCYKYAAKIESIPDGSKEYYDLVVKKTGSEINDSGAVSPAHDSLISYQEKKYEETR